MRSMRYGGLQRVPARQWEQPLQPLVGEPRFALRRATFVPVMKAADLGNGDDGSSVGRADLP
jgi:hypothetical protein